MNKIGHGFDVHRLIKGRKCIIGGVEIDFPLGLDGHSDADVLIHAISDSILGAVGRGDIGQHFSDQDPLNKDMDSRVFLKKIQNMISDDNYKIGNIDATIICEQPKIFPYIENMKINIANDLKCDQSKINIKATTTEKLGFIGRGEGIAAQAVCLLEKN